MLKIVHYGNEVLEKPCEPITNFGEYLKEWADAMYETMLDNNGIGLAAPQVGESKSFFVLDTLEKEGIGRLNLVNPSIIYYSEETVVMNEGCLSVPQVFLPVERPAIIKVECQKLNGKKLSFTAKGLLARVIQHEMDHLLGKIFLDLVKDEAALEEAKPMIDQIREKELAILKPN